MAQVHIADGRFAEAVSALRSAHENTGVLGALHGPLLARLIEALFLEGRVEGIARVSSELEQHAPDPRYYEETAPARAIAIHLGTKCRGECMTLTAELDTASAHGAHGTAAIGHVKALPLIHLCRF